MTLLFIYLSIAITVSFICSIVEAVILSITSSFIEIKINEQSKTAHYLKLLKENINRPLSAILTVNTIAHTIGAAGVGAQAVAVFGEIYFGLISAILTFLILFFSEIIPKTIGAVYWKTLAIPSAYVIRIMVFITYPLVVISEFVSRIISKNKKEFTTSREEVVAIARLGRKEGILNAHESKIIASLIKARDINLDAIMTPRTVLVSAEEHTAISEFIKNKEFLLYSRIPVYSKSIDNITGYILNSDLLEIIAHGSTSKQLIDIKRKISVFNETTKIPEVFEKLIINREQIALVTSEYGGTEGIVTMEDVVETLLGLEIIDEKDTVADLQKLARHRWETKQQQLNSANNTE